MLVNVGVWRGRVVRSIWRMARRVCRNLVRLRLRWRRVTMLLASEWAQRKFVYYGSVG